MFNFWPRAIRADVRSKRIERVSHYGHRRSRAEEFVPRRRRIHCVDVDVVRRQHGMWMRYAATGRQRVQSGLQKVCRQIGLFKSGETDRPLLLDLWWDFQMSNRYFEQLVIDKKLLFPTFSILVTPVDTYF